MKYKCIIFDCDGVLVDSELISSRVLVELANSIGAQIDMTFAEINFTGKAFEDVFNQIEDIAGMNAIIAKEHSNSSKRRSNPSKGYTNYLMHLQSHIA